MVKQSKNYGSGMRRLYKDLLDDQRMVYPRYKESFRDGATVKRSKLKHPEKWYLDGHLVNRPVYGVYALAIYAEHLLYLVKFGHRGRGFAIPPVASFYAETRRVMRDFLTSCKLNGRIPKAVKERMSNRVLGLIESAKEARAAVDFTKKKCTCPACKGANMSSYDAELLESLLLEWSAKGDIPKESTLYRETPLT